MTSKRSLTVTALAILLMLGKSGAAYAAEVHVLCSLGLKSVMEELAPQFERSSGHKVVVEYGLAAQIKQQIEGGKDFDLAVLTPPHIDDLIKQSKMAADSRAVIARTGLGLMIKAGGRKPDLSNTEFKPTASGEEVNTLVLSGGADFGVLPRSEILPVKGAELGGMFPADVQTYISGVNSKARQGAAARDLLKFLTSAGVLPTIKAKGMERG